MIKKKRSQSRCFWENNALTHKSIWIEQSCEACVCANWIGSKTVAWHGMAHRAFVTINCLARMIWWNILMEWNLIECTDKTLHFFLFVSVSLSIFSAVFRPNALYVHARIKIMICRNDIITIWRCWCWILRWLAWSAIASSHIFVRCFFLLSCLLGQTV